MLILLVMLKRLIRLKTYWDRSRTYVSSLAFIISIFTALKVHEDTPLGMWVYGEGLVNLLNMMFIVQRLPTLLITIIIVFFTWGFLDYRHIRPVETSITNKVNPEVMQILKLNKEMHDKIMKL